MSKQPNWSNPENVPETRLGKGYRFLTKEEADYLRTDTGYKGAVFESISGFDWCDGFDGTSVNWTYRTRKPLGYFLPKKPKPKRKVEGPSKGYMDAYNKFMGTGYKDPQSCIAGTMMPFHFFNAGRRYERRRLRAGG